MSGHSKWSQIKHKKGAADAKRSKAFSQLSRAITLAARENGSDPALNAQLRSAIESAQAANMPKDTIQRAITKATSNEEQLSRVLYEAYGPAGVAIIIEGITDNNNRTFAEVRKILESHNAKMAPGGASWAFVKDDTGWKPTTTVPADKTARAQLDALIETLEEHDDVQAVHTNREAGT
jgi:YebC/PmpR family DNA-binding regulatory protein